MSSATSVLRRISMAGLVLAIALAVVALPACRSPGKRGGHSTARPSGAAHSPAKKYKDPVSDFLATNPRVPLDGGK